VNQLRDYYLPLLAKHGATAKGVGWGSELTQLVRLHKITDALPTRDSVLDVGCGYGALGEQLVKRGQLLGWTQAYSGIDILPEMVDKAQERGLYAETGDIREGKWRADWVVASGLFTFSNPAEVREIVTAMWASCRKGVIFNCLSTWAHKVEGEFAADPADMLDFCRTLTHKVVLRHDYLPHDFTVVMLKEDEKCESR